MPFDTEQTSEKTDKTGDADPAMQRKVVSIVGPTASGKTGLGIAVAKALACKGEQAEIINADAYQMYRGMDIGTAKASRRSRRRSGIISSISSNRTTPCPWRGSKSSPARK